MDRVGLTERALARIRERPAFERLREHVRETDRLRKAF